MKLVTSTSRSDPTTRPFTRTEPMTRHGMAPMVGLALCFAAGCVDSNQDDAAQTANALLASTPAVHQDLRSTLDRFGAQMERLDQRYLGAAADVAEAWSNRRSEIREYREALESNLARLEGASVDEARRLKREMAEDLERLTDRLERAELEAIEDDRAFLSASRDCMDRLEEDLRALGDEAASLSEEARDEASDTLEALRDRASELAIRLDALTDATAEEIASRRTDIAQELGALTASVRRELFEMRQVGTD